MPAPRPIAALALLALVGCAAGTGSLGGADAGGGIEVRELSLQGGFLRVTLKIPQRPPGRKPVLVAPVSDETALLERGVIVVRFRQDWSVLAGLGQPDPSAPEPGGDAGTRVGLWMLAAPRPGIVGRNYFAVIGVSAEQSVPRILDELETLPEVDPQRIGIAGSSTGGFVALEALAGEPRLAGAVVRVACGDYRRFLRSSSLALADDPRWLENGEPVLDADYAAVLRRREPLGRADAYPPRPLLMLNGRRDEAIPFACAERTAAALRAAYAEAGVPDRFRFVVYDDAGHDLGHDAMDEALAWWERWLLGAPGAPP